MIISIQGRTTVNFGDAVSKILTMHPLELVDIYTTRFETDSLKES